MLRLAKLTDYATVVMTELARAGGHHSAADLAQRGQLPTDAVRKVLKALTRAGLVASQRGAHGGYALARPPESISVTAIVEAIEGPIALTECSIHDHRCSIEDSCVARGNWHLINRAVRLALDQVSLADMASPASSRIAALARRFAPPSHPTGDVRGSVSIPVDAIARTAHPADPTS